MSLQTTDREIRELVSRIDEVQTVRAGVKDLERTLSTREAELRDQLRFHLDALDERSALVAGISVMIRTVRKIEVTSEDDLIRAVTEADRLAEFMVFDRNRAKITAVEEEWPGIFITKEDQLVISKREGKR